MNRAWLQLAVGVAVGALALVLWGHRPKPSRPAPPPAAPAPIDTLTLVVRDGAVAPATASVPLGHRLALLRVNAGHAAVRVSLAGYEHALPEAALAPGAARRDTFVLDLPGGDFAWRLDGVPAGQLAVAGSHLAEGHR